MAIQKPIALSGAIAVLAGCMLWTEANVAGQSSAGLADYQQWVKRYAPTNVDGSFGREETKPIKLIVVTVDGEEKAEAVDPPFGSRIVVSGAQVSIDGFTSYFSHSARGGKGSSGGPALNATDLKRLNELLATLPDDHSRLPPAGRRLLLRANVDGRWNTQVYDCANAPDALWEIMRLGRCGVGSWVPQFQPSSVMDVRGFEFGGFLCLSPDRKKILFTSDNGPLQFWDPVTHEFLEEVRAPGVVWNSMAFSPDGSMAVVGGSEYVCFDTKTWKTLHKFQERRTNGGYFTLTSPQFTSDGRHVMLECNKPSLEIFEVQTWNHVNGLPWIPEDALQFVPSPKNRRAVARLKLGAVVLWDIAKHRQIASLGTNVFLEHVCFSPDESLVAVATAQSSGYLNYWGDPAIRIWNTASGKRVSDLRPFERAAYDNVNAIAWSPDGQYVLAADKPDGFFSSRNISVFNVKTGRHRGDFVGCPTEVNGMALIGEGSQLAAGCSDGKIRIWDFKSGLNEIKKFEASLAVTRTGTKELTP